MPQQAYGVYSRQDLESPELLVWVFAKGKDALSAFGRDVTGVAYKKHTDSLKHNDLVKGPNSLRSVNDATRRAFAQNEARLPYIKQCIHDKRPIVFEPARDKILKANTAQPLGLFHTDSDKLVWLFPSTAKGYAALGYGGTSNTKGNNAMKAGKGRITKPFMHARWLEPSEVQAYHGNEEDREEEMKMTLSAGTAFERKDKHGTTPLVKCSDAACQDGFQPYTDENFYLNATSHHRRCRTCTTRIRHAREDKHWNDVNSDVREGKTHFTCVKCNLETPLNQKDGDRWWCKACRKH